MVEKLDGYDGATILDAETARDVAAAFDVGLDESMSELRPISEMDRLQPDNDDLGIGVGTLCKSICARLDGIEAEDFLAGGHGTTQRGLKKRNLPKLEAYADDR
jgi:hypothetical protein